MPLPVQNPQAEAINSTHISVTWEKQEKSVSDRYECTYTYLNRQGGMPLTQSTSMLSLMLNDLFPGERYSIIITAKSNGINSKAEDISSTTCMFNFTF